MSWRTNSAVLSLRNAGRALGINKFVAGLVARGYEEDYEAGLSTCIRPGDTVWDIGANVGLYTLQFSRQVGPGGRVVAFEPSPTNFTRLEEATASLSNVTLQGCGLGDANATLMLQQGEDELGATTRVGGSDGVAVDVRVGDELIAAGLSPPHVIKLDVEGFEGEVMRGLSRCLQSPALRAVGIEVHFGILEERGRSGTPRELERDLRAAGFRVRWPDASHILAVRD